MALDSEGTGLASSLTDLMTSLAVIFILLLVASHNNEQEDIETRKGVLTRKQQDVEDLQARLEKAQRELEEAKKTTGTARRKILEELQRALESFKTERVRADVDHYDPLGLLVIVPEDLLKFAKDEDKIPLGGVKFLGRFIPKLAETICLDDLRKEASSMVIEGHTDPSGTDAINLPLSQARSMAVVRESLNLLNKATADPSAPSTLRACFLSLLSASGRGSSEPRRDDNDRVDPDPSHNRRVEFKIRVRSLEQRQVQEAQEVKTP